MRIVNMTPHTINLPDVSIPSSGSARVSETATQIDTIDGICICKKSYGAVEGLPEPQSGVYYIVSSIVLAAAPDRSDLLVPHDMIRDADGRIVGCKALARY